MPTDTREPWQHDHTFAQDQRRSGESRTLIVIALTAVNMAVEIHLWDHCVSSENDSPH